MVKAQILQGLQRRCLRAVRQALVLAGRTNTVRIEQRGVQQHQQRHDQPGHGRIDTADPLQPRGGIALQRRPGIAQGIEHEHAGNGQGPDALMRPAVLAHAQRHGPQGQGGQHRHQRQGGSNQGPQRGGVRRCLAAAVLVNGIHKNQQAQQHPHQQRGRLARFPQRLHAGEGQKSHEQHHHQRQ